MAGYGPQRHNGGEHNQLTGQIGVSIHRAGQGKGRVCAGRNQNTQQAYKVHSLKSRVHQQWQEQS